MLKVSEIGFEQRAARADVFAKYGVELQTADRLFALDEAEFIGGEERLSPLGLAQLGYEGGIVVRRLFTDEAAPAVYREFLARVIVNALMDCHGPVKTLFYDSLLLRFGFEKSGEGMAADCRELKLPSDCKDGAI